jgi:hypothetical protein
MKESVVRVVPQLFALTTPSAVVETVAAMVAIEVYSVVADTIIIMVAEVAMAAASALAADGDVKKKRRKHCHVCGCWGHRGAVCPQRAAPRDEYVPIKTEKGALAAKENSDSGQSLDALVALSALPLYGGAPINDPGCSHHMTGDSTLLHDYKDLFSGNGMKYHGAESTAVNWLTCVALSQPLGFVHSRRVSRGHHTAKQVTSAEAIQSRLHRD